MDSAGLGAIVEVSSPAGGRGAERVLMEDIPLTLNGEARTIRADPTASLLDVLREQAGLMGARYGCGAGQCGACAVLIDGEDKPSCQAEIGNLAGKSVTTIEGVGTPE